MSADPAFTSSPDGTVHYAIYDSSVDSERAACGAEAMILSMSQGWDRVTCQKCWADGAPTRNYAPATFGAASPVAPSGVTPVELIDVVLRPMSDLINDALSTISHDDLTALNASIADMGSGKIVSLATAEPAPVTVPTSQRRRLPDERKSVTRHFKLPLPVDPVAPGPPILDIYVQVGLHDDGTPGEIFITAAKQGSFTSGALDCMAKMTSLALQHGASIETVVRQLRGTRFEPSGWVMGQGQVTSVADMIARWLESRFCPTEATA